MAELFADALAPPPPPKLGFTGALSTFFGGDPTGAYTEGLNTGSQYRMRSAQTEEALARAETERTERIRKQQEIDAINKAQADPNYRGTFADMLTLGRNPQQYGIDPLSVQEHGFRSILGDVGADPATQFAAGQGVQGRVLPRIETAGGQNYNLATDPNMQAPTMTPLQQADVAAAQALAGQRNRAPASGGFTVGGVRYNVDGTPAVDIDQAAANASTMAEATARGRAAGSPAATGAGGAKPLTEFQVKTLSQLSRMDRTEQELTSPAFAQYVPSLADVAMDAVPGVGNYAISKEFQQYKQLANEWISGLLRLDSGAAVPETEFKRYFTAFFPQAGDGPETVAQKAQARTAATGALRTAVPGIAATIDASRVPAPGAAPPAAGGEVMRGTSKSGKPIISRNGGKTWEYE